MTFAHIAAGASLFLEANTLIYHFANDPKYGSAYTQLSTIALQRVVGQTKRTSSHVKTAAETVAANTRGAVDAGDASAASADAALSCIAFQDVAGRFDGGAAGVQCAAAAVAANARDAGRPWIAVVAASASSTEIGKL